MRRQLFHINHWKPLLHSSKQLLGVSLTEAAYRVHLCDALTAHADYPPWLTGMVVGASVVHPVIRWASSSFVRPLRHLLGLAAIRQASPSFVRPPRSLLDFHVVR